MDSERPCNDVTQTPKGLVVYIIMYPAYVFLKTFIESLLTFRYLIFGVNFMYGVRDCSNSLLIFFLLITLTCSFIVSLTNLYLQHQGRNIPFSPHLLHQLVLSSFWQWPFWGLRSNSFLWFWFSFLIFSKIYLFSCVFFSRVNLCYLSIQLLVTRPCFKLFSDDCP